MRQIKYIVLHCTATKQNATVKSIQDYWRNVLGWKSPGYHFLIEKTGKVHELHPIELPSNGVAGYNKNSIHISYIGGIDFKGKAIDNRTQQQQDAQLEIIMDLLSKFPNAKVLGHRDFPGVKKECPSFDVQQWINLAMSLLIDLYSNLPNESCFVL